MRGYSTSLSCFFRSGGSAQCGVCHRRGLSEGLIRRRRCRWTTRRLSLVRVFDFPFGDRAKRAHVFAALQTHDRGDFVAVLWLSSRYSHTSLLSYALPYLRVVDKTPPAFSTLRSPTTIFTFTTSFPSPSGSGTVNPFFCYLIPALSASRVCFFLGLPWSQSPPIVPSKANTPFIFIIYVKIPLPIHLPTSHPDLQLRTTTTRLLSSPHCTFTGSRCT